MGVLQNQGRRDAQKPRKTTTLNPAPLQRRRRAFAVAIVPAVLCFAVVADGLDGAALHRLLAEGLLLRAFRLLENEGMSPVIIPLEIRRRRFATQIAVNALVVHIEKTVDVLRVAIGKVCHNETKLKMDREATGPAQRTSIQMKCNEQPAWMRSAQFGVVPPG